MSDRRSAIKVYLVNGESRSVRLDDRMDVTDIVKSVLQRLRVNMDVAPQLFSILLSHVSSGGETYWLQPGFSITEQLQTHIARHPLEEWRFLLRMRVLPRTPQHLLTQDPVTFQYYYDQVLHRYLCDSDIEVSNEIAVKLGCLELRRFFKDMPQIALKKKENFDMLEKDIGLEKFFKPSLISSVKRKNLRTMVLQAFQNYESLTNEGCVFQFFSVLSKFHAIDEEIFSSCAYGDNQLTTLTSVIYVGANCNVEWGAELGGERSYLAAFSDIYDISYEMELMSRGRVIMDVKTAGMPVVIRTATLTTAVHMATLIDAYCMVYTTNPHSRMSGIGRRTYSDPRLSGHYSTADIDPYSISMATSSIHDDYAEVKEPDRQMLGRPIQPREVILEERIGEGQFGDVHKGVLYPGRRDEVAVAIKTCKPDASHEDRVKFLEEAAVMKKFEHPHIIRLFGVVTHEKQTYIVMELAPLGQLRRYLLSEGSRIHRLVLLQYIHQLSSAMVHLEAKSYVHRDIAARNVLVTTPEVVKLADFGLSRGLQDGDYYVASRGKLPIKWMAPESINFRRFTGLSDVWMFGVCCWEVMMRGVKPFVGIKNDEVISKIELGERLPLPADTPPPLFGLMNCCWSYEPEKRPNFRQVERAVAEVLEEERQLASLPSHRPLLHDPAPQKPPYRPHSSQGFMQVKRSSLLSDDENHSNRLSGNLEDSPALPPRIATRFRELSPSPHHFDHTSSPPRNDGETPPPKPPRKASPDLSSETSHLRSNPPPIVPYSVTTITHGDSGRGSDESRHSESPCHPVSTAPIPPPSILLRSNEGPDHTPSGGVYYSIPEEGVRSLREDGQFVSSPGNERNSITCSESSREGGEGQRGEEEEEKEEERGDIVEEEEVLGKVTGVVKSVMELSNKVYLSPPDEYLELVKGVGMAMRELLHTVDSVRQQIPVPLHHEMDMAQKVLSSDFQQLIKAMKDAQKNANTFLEESYRKEMLGAAHIVAKNSKLLFDAVVACIRRSRP